jgi:hypothetical protein
MQVAVMWTSSNSLTLDLCIEFSASNSSHTTLVLIFSSTIMQIVDGKFKDDRWINGRWDLSQFAGADGNTDWDKVCIIYASHGRSFSSFSRCFDSMNDIVCIMQVIDAEIARRKLLEDSPIPSTNEDPVLFDTAEIPWWAWVRRFHLPEVRG